MSSIAHVLITPMIVKNGVVRKHTGYIDCGFAHCQLTDSNGKRIKTGIVPHGHNMYPDATKCHHEHMGIIGDSLPIVMDEARLVNYATGTYTGMNCVGVVPEANIPTA